MSIAAANIRPTSRIFTGLPPFGRGQRIGLFGGSFNPPHPGHRQMALIALNRLRLDAVWWLVTPGNPLKTNGNLRSLASRMEETAMLAAHPRMPVSGAEAQLNIRYTADLVARLTRPGGSARFVWIMGSDNLATFHLWERWKEIANRVPIAIVNRPGTLTAPLNAPAAHYLSSYRVNEMAASCLADHDPPAWTFITGPRTPASSTALRETVKSQHKSNS